MTGCAYGVTGCAYGVTGWVVYGVTAWVVYGAWVLCVSCGVAISWRNDGATTGTLDAGATTDCGTKDGICGVPLARPGCRYPLSVTGSMVFPRIYFLDAGVAASAMWLSTAGG